MNDLELLRAHEPIVRYTSGELFFPTSVDQYFAECDLWVGRSDRERTMLAPRGELTPDRLATFEAPPGQSLFLRLVQAPLNRIELTRWTLRPHGPSFKAPGRLARVGLFARLVDAGFTASLLVRGTVPGGTAAAASVKYEHARERDPRFVYHGRVIRRDGWILLHYMYFYFMNDWRSTFSGANDHEADWEQAFVVLEDRPGGSKPVWFAVAAHDYSGDDLRRRWDDPLLVREGDHPVIHAGAGSHAGYFERGEYLTMAPVPALRGLPGLLGAVRSFWRDTLRQEDPGDLAARFTNALSVPFVDYARGDGMSIGPGQTGEWSPILIDDSTPWVDGYRGLFGLDTYDRFAGERAPAGPKYGRSGTVRQTWHDPVGWAGLSKVAPPHLAPTVLAERIDQLIEERATLESKIAATSAELPGLDLEVRSLATNGAMAGLFAARRSEMLSREAGLAQLQTHHAELTDTIAATRQKLERLRAGDQGDPRAHLSQEHHPVPPEDTRYGYLVELWSAISIAVVLLAIVSLTLTRALPWWAALIVGIATYLVLDAAFRRRLGLLLLRVTLVLAIVSAGVLVLTFARDLVLLGIAGLAVLIVADNVREISRR